LLACAMITTMEIFYVNSQHFDTKGLTKREIELELGRLVVDYAAEKHYGLKDREVVIENKKPRFKCVSRCDSGGGAEPSTISITQSPQLHFSISHSKNIILAAFDTHPVGVDVEFLKERDFAAILKYLKAEGVKADMESFYTFWTAYEAKIKLQEEAKSVLTLKPLPDFILSIASARVVENAQIQELNRRILGCLKKQ